MERNQPAARKLYAIYILASQRNGTLYIGMTNDLPRRVEQHALAATDSFTRRYGVTILVHVEWFDDIRDALAREKQLKRWKRAWKIRLIETGNPNWEELPAW